MAAVSSEVSLDSVQKITIGGICYESRPCFHNCTITLRDGRKLEIEYLNAHKIDSLIQDIALEKVSSIYSIRHFAGQRRGELEDATEILNQYFSQKD